MIDFKEEIGKYEPILEIENIETAIHAGEMNDILDMLTYITKSKKSVQANGDASPIDDTRARR